MGADSKISWCDHTFNPWVGCTKVSAGCDYCYAESWAKRSGLVEWGPGAPRRRTKTWGDPIKWNREAEKKGVRYRVFCASLADWLDVEVDPVWRADLLDLIRETPNLDWLLLTKRHKLLWDFVDAYQVIPNARLGMTVEDSHAADMRMPVLHRVKRRGWNTFISYEPAIDRLAWGSAWWDSCDWLICGAESGPKRRPFDENWARDARDACRHYGIPFLYKQIIRDGRKVELPELDGRTWEEFPF